MRSADKSRCVDVDIEADTAVDVELGGLLPLTVMSAPASF